MESQSQRYSLCIADSSTSFLTPLPFQCTILIDGYVLILYYVLTAVGLLLVLYFVCQLAYARRLNLLHELEQMSAMDTDNSTETLNVQTQSEVSGTMPQGQNTGSQVKLSQALQEESQRKSQILGKIRSSMSQHRSFNLNSNRNASTKQMLYQSVEHTSQVHEESRHPDITVIQDDASQSSLNDKKLLLTSSNDTREPAGKVQNTIEMNAQQRNPYPQRRESDDDLDTNHNVTQDFIQKVILHDTSESMLLPK